MNTIIKIGLGIALALPLSSITTVKDAYGIVEAPSSFRALSNIPPKDLVAHSPMSGEQLAAIEGMAGICISCLDKTTIDRLVQTLRQRGEFSVDAFEAMVNQSNQFVIGAGPVTQSNQAMVNQTMINQTFSPTNQQLSVVRVQQSQTLTTQFPNEQVATNLAREIRTSTQAIIDQNLSQLLQNALPPNQSPIGSGGLAQEIIIRTQEIIQPIVNGTVNATTINQQFPNIPRGGFLR